MLLVSGDRTMARNKVLEVITLKGRKLRDGRWRYNPVGGVRVIVENHVCELDEGIYSALGF